MTRGRRDARRSEPADFADRFRALAESRRNEICETIVERAVEGERWAVELVIKYAFEPQPGSEATDDPLLTVLEEIRAELDEGS